MADFYKQIGIQMKRIRENKKLTLTQVEKLSGISRSNLSKYENGKKAMSLDILYRWSVALKIKMSSPFRQIEDSRRNPTIHNTENML